RSRSPIVNEYEAPTLLADGVPLVTFGLKPDSSTKCSALLSTTASVGRQGREIEVPRIAGIYIKRRVPNTLPHRTCGNRSAVGRDTATEYRGVYEGDVRTFIESEGSDAATPGTFAWNSPECHNC